MGPTRRRHEREETPKPDPKPRRRRIDVTLDGLQSLAEIGEAFPAGTLIEIVARPNAVTDEVALIEVEVKSVRFQARSDLT